jgi:hypothetical protein
MPAQLALYMWTCSYDTMHTFNIATILPVYTTPALKFSMQKLTTSKLGLTFRDQ